MAETPEKERPESFMPFGEKELFDSRTVLISSPVNAKLAHMINSRLLALERANRKDPIYVFINSPGGEVHSGYSIFDTMRFIECQVVTIVTGLAASMGSIIALAAPKERRFSMPNAKFLIHQPSVHGGLGGSVSDIEIHARDLIETKNQIVQLYVKETGRTESEIRTAIDRDKWMTPPQALEFGLISKIISRRSELPA
jgi:ATP-dependent Clp protease protease subunit